MKEKEFYRRNLPHYQPQNAVLFMTARLYGSIPKARLNELKEAREIEENRLRKLGLTEEELRKALRGERDLYFGKFDHLLDNNTKGPHWLKNDKIAQIWFDALKYFDGERYTVICSTIMSNHVHFIFYKLDRKLSQIMKSLKGFSAFEINKILKQENPTIALKSEFWQDESFDRYIRDRADLRAKIFYILNNPVKAGIVEHWEDYEWNYIQEDFRKFL